MSSTCDKLSRVLKIALFKTMKINSKGVYYIYKYTHKVYDIIKERRLQNEEVGAVKDP